MIWALDAIFEATQMNKIIFLLIILQTQVFAEETKTLGGVYYVVPSKFKEITSEKKDGYKQFEYIPNTQTKDNFKEIYSVQSFENLKNIKIINFFGNYLTLMKKTCPKVKHLSIVTDKKNPHSSKPQTHVCFCSKNNGLKKHGKFKVNGINATNMGSFTLVKAVKGNNTLYVAIKEWRIPEITKMNVVLVKYYKTVEMWSKFFTDTFKLKK